MSSTHTTLATTLTTSITTTTPTTSLTTPLDDVCLGQCEERIAFVSGSGSTCVCLSEICNHESSLVRRHCCPGYRHTCPSTTPTTAATFDVDRSICDGHCFDSSLRTVDRGPEGVYLCTCDISCGGQREINDIKDPVEPVACCPGRLESCPTTTATSTASTTLVTSSV